MHFVGIGGAGMSGIARIMLARGLPVSGSDAKDSVTLAALRALGATVHVGHAAAQRGRRRHRRRLDGDPRGQPRARRGAPARAATSCTARGALAAVMVGRRAVAVAGTHGKTTTTSMLTVALQHCGADPSFAIGGNLNESGANAHNGTGDVFVAEADESDGSFLLYSPTAAVVTNVEPDHLDHYGTAEAVAAAFEAFAERIEPDGFLVALRRRPGRGRAGGVARARPGSPCAPTASAPTADLRLVDLETNGPRQLVRGGAARPSARPGRAADPGPAQRAERRGRAHGRASALGFPVERLREGLATFSGTRRRFEHKGTVAGVRVFDSYAHHPTELTADLHAAREVAGGGRVVVVFQPHLYSRTRSSPPSSAQALGLADEVVVMDVYAAREDPEPGVTGRTGRGGRPAAAGPGRLRAVLVGRRRSPGRARPARRRRDHAAAPAT